MKKKFVALFGLVLFVLASKSLCSAGELLQRTDFEDGLSSPWFVSESENVSSRSEVVDGNYIIRIHNLGSNIWGVSCSHDGFQIVKGHTYHVNFSVSSTKDCMIYAKIGDEGIPSRQVWNNNSSIFSLKSNEILKVSTEFKAEFDCPNAEFAFGLGGVKLAPTSYDIKLISISLVDEEFASTPKLTPTPKYGIRVNQLGYYPKGDKIAILRADGESENTTVNWELKNSSGQTVYKGTASEFVRDAGSGEYCYTIDFSGFKTPGKGYRLYCGDEFSLPFDIDTDIYSEMKYDALKYFYHARSGTEIEMPYCEENQWARPAGHTEDTAEIFSSGEYTGPETIDATGGMYTEGNNGKSMINAGLSVWTLQNQYEFAVKTGYNKDFDDKTLNIPESGNKIPDILDEARWEMEWMLNMQIPEGNDKAGMAIHKVSSNNSIFSLTSNDLERRLFYAPTTAATLNLSACAAQAARLWKDLDKNFSDKCLLAAETAWAAAKKDPDIICINTGYDGDENFKDEFYWAACELYLTTKKTLYLEDMKSSEYYCKAPYAKTSEKEEIFTSPGHSTRATLGTLSLALLAKDEFPQAVEEIIKTADYFLYIRDYEAYRVTLPVSEYIIEYGGVREIIMGYPPFSNQTILENAILMAYAYDKKKDTTYLSALRDSLDYIVGRNPILKCYVTGYGANPAKYPYHMFFANIFKPASPTVPKGFVVSGPNSHWDIWATAGGSVLTPPPQKFYTDSTDSWLTNSVSVDLNAALAWVTAYSDAIGDVEYAPVEDINKDGVVNMSDVILLAKVFNLNKSDSLFDKKCDLNNDGVINMADVMKIAVSFGSVYSN